MPPRRSSRLSAEPESLNASVASTSSTSKRKRSSSTLPDAEDKENVKKSTRSTRRSATPSGVTRRSTRTVSGRGRPAPELLDVPESGDEGPHDEDEEEAELRAKKKARPSTSGDEADDYDEKPAAKLPPKRQSKPVKSPQKIPRLSAVDAADDDMSFLEEDTRPRKPKSISQMPRTPTKPKKQADGDVPEISLLEPSGSVPIPLPRSPAKSVGSPSKAHTHVLEPEKPKSRLVIHKMALVNFKSYAGRQEIGPFHKSFSAIVGPNGSGKSNTIDALLFVFGYRANKMRQAKLSELIHNSSRYPDLPECSVEVHFREIRDLPGPDAFEVIPKSSLVVARHAFRNNSSKYTINGASSTFTEVQTLLKARGIDLDHKRFLILQGEVESISQMPPKSQTGHDEGLLEYLEDIIGSNKYKEPIEKAAGEMDEIEDDRREKINRLKYVEKERDALAKKKKEAEDYLRACNELARARSLLYQWYIYQGFRKEDKANLTIGALNRDLEELEEQFKDDLHHIKELEEHFKMTEEAYEEVRQKSAAATQELEKEQGIAAGLGERKKHAAKKLNKLKKGIDDDQKALQAAQRAIEDNADKIEKEKAKILDYEAKLKEAEDELARVQEGLYGKTKKFSDQIEVKQRELQPWQEKINQKEAEVNIATSEKDALVKKAEDMKDACTKAQTELDELKSDLEVKVSERKKLQQDHAGFSESITRAEQEWQRALEKKDDLQKKLGAARAKFVEARSSREATQSQGRVLDQLTSLKQQGRLNGFHGRLGSLGTIDAKYDVAITTACSALGNIVVDNVATAEAAMDYLRKNNIGRGTFIPLDKVHVPPSFEKTPGGVPRLFELVRPKDPKYAGAFFKALSHTLVADDLDHARKIAYGSNKTWRVVTLQGQIIESSGAMSGGGSAPQRGGMSQTLPKDPVDPSTLHKMEREVDDLYGKHQEATNEARHWETEIDRYKVEKPKREMEAEKLKLDIEGGKRRIEDEEKRVRNLLTTKQDAKEVARIRELDKIIAKQSSELGGLQEASSEIEAAIAELNQKILDVGGVKLLAQKSKVEGFRNYISISNDDITKAEVASTKAEKDITKLKKSLDGDRQAYATQNEELAEIEAELADKEAYVTELDAAVEAASTAEEEKKEQLTALRTNLNEKQTGIEEYKTQRQHVETKLLDANKELKEAQQLVSTYDKRHQALKLVDVDDDDDEDEEGGNSDNKSKPQDETAPPDPPEKEEEEGDTSVKPDPDAAPLPTKRQANVDEKGFEQFQAPHLQSLREKNLQGDVALLEEKVKKSPDMTVLKEWKRRDAEFLRRVEELDGVTAQRDEKKTYFDKLRTQRLQEFMAGFTSISSKLKEMYQLITLGGIAELELVDSLDPFSEGIIFSVMPPKKSWKNISNLSGGEKTLSSLALVFALHVFKPTPLYFMDEIDAALDFRNVSIVANYIKDRTKNAQFIIISLRNDMFELSHRLIGIYKTANATHTLAIDNKNLRDRESSEEKA